MIFAEPVVIVLTLGERKMCDLPFHPVAGESPAICTQQGKHVAVTFAITKANMGGQPSSVGQHLVSLGAKELLHEIERYNETVECPPDIMEYLDHCHKTCLQIRNQRLSNCFASGTVIDVRQT
jgi:hypothetical protein